MENHGIAGNTETLYHEGEDWAEKTQVRVGFLALGQAWLQEGEASDVRRPSHVKFLDSTVSGQRSMPPTLLIQGSATRTTFLLTTGV